MTSGKHPRFIFGQSAPWLMAWHRPAFLERSASPGVIPIDQPVDGGAMDTGALCRIGDRQTLFNFHDDLAAALP